MQNKTNTNPKISKTSIQKVISAHQKAPLDYISPWEAHHHQLYLAQSQGSESLHSKNKSGQDSKQSVVHSFLEKIRKTHQKYQKSRIARNYSHEERDSYGVSLNNSSLGINPTNITELRGLRNDGVLRSETFGPPKDSDK